jgi:hypothetical protein
MLVLGLIACQQGSLPEGAMSPAASQVASGHPVDADVQQLVALASQQLANRLDIHADAISLVRVREVEWQDASLGCPKPNVDYLRQSTPGYVLLLEAAGTEYEFHTDDAQRVVSCPAGK